MSAGPSTPQPSTSSAATPTPWRPPTTTAATGSSSSSSSASRPHSSSAAARFHPHATSAAPAAFTPTMRDRQARGKDPYSPGASDVPLSSRARFRQAYAPPYGYGLHADSDFSDYSDDDDDAERRRQRRQRRREKEQPFALAERRRDAATVLDCPELLMYYAQSSGDSIPATRLRFMKIMCGYDEDEHGQQPAPAAGTPGRSGGGVGGSSKLGPAGGGRNRRSDAGQR